jgi:hypothetical protein
LPSLTQGLHGCSSLEGRREEAAPASGQWRSRGDHKDLSQGQHRMPHCHASSHNNSTQHKKVKYEIFYKKVKSKVPIYNFDDILIQQVTRKKELDSPFSLILKIEITLRDDLMLKRERVKKEVTKEMKKNDNHTSSHMS